MPDGKNITDAAKKGPQRDEAEADDTARHEPAPSSIDEGDPATKDDGSGTSETD